MIVGIGLPCCKRFGQVHRYRPGGDTPTCPADGELEEIASASACSTRSRAVP